MYSKHNKVSKFEHIANFSTLCWEKDVYKRFQGFQASATFYFCANQKVPFSKTRPTPKQPALLRKCMSGLAYFTNERSSQQKWKHSTRANALLCCISPKPDVYSVEPYENPPGENEVTKRVVSEDSRIASTLKLQQLMRLCDQVLRSCSCLFHCSEIYRARTKNLPQLYTIIDITCDINDRIELRCIWKCLVENMCIGESEMTVQGHFVRLELVNDCDITSHSFFAVVNDLSGESAPFWKGKVFNLIWISTQMFTSPTDHWYEMRNEFSALYEKSCSSYFHGKGRVKQRLWADVVTSEAVLVSFSTFRRRKTLQSTAYKMMQS